MEENKKIYKVWLASGKLHSIEYDIIDESKYEIVIKYTRAIVNAKANRYEIVNKEGILKELDTNVADFLLDNKILFDHDKDDNHTYVHHYFDCIFTYKISYDTTKEAI